jgi:hypothetical protein
MLKRDSVFGTYRAWTIRGTKNRCPVYKTFVLEMGKGGHVDSAK